MRMRKKKNLDLRIENCAPILIQNPAELRGSWLSKREERELHLEIGCGKGKFTVETAEANPEALHVAVERERNAMVIAMERALSTGLSNLLFIDADARYLTELFAPGEVSRIYINFPDPWPGERYAKRRLTSPLFLDLYKEILKPGGEIHFKTDNRPLFDYSIGQFPSQGFLLEDVTTDLHTPEPRGVMTNYEQKFHELGTPICRCVARWEG